MTESPELISLRKSLGGPLDGLPADVQKQIAGNAIELVLDGVERGLVPLQDWEKRCIAEALQQLRGHHHELARAAARRALWPDENRRVSEIRKHPIRPGMTTLAEFRRVLATVRELPPALSFAKARAARQLRVAQADHVGNSRHSRASLTGGAAAALGLADRGLLREGQAADVVLFDPATIIDRSTYDEPHQHPAGIGTVIVNGTIVIDGGEHTSALPGRLLRRRGTVLA